MKLGTVQKKYILLNLIQTLPSIISLNDCYEFSTNRCTQKYVPVSRNISFLFVTVSKLSFVYESRTRTDKLHCLIFREIEENNYITGLKTICISWAIF